MPTQPKPEQIQALFTNAPPGPLVMLNLLKFKKKAEYADGRQTDISGAEAYGIYAGEMRKFIEADGGRMVFSALMNVLVIGEGDLEWDVVGIAEYASLKSFQKITASTQYQEINVHRDAGLAHQLLINCLTPD
ncbi:MAG: DUF1330 domain-containing protein [Deltaproteobacteria bacterium]|nr:DUF1330 domain-containing protein [Deltaproteobacteria bacterium]MBW2181568.1 DUF1330 domain-containing protein [Deltaproteobacteria bacterium]